MLSKNRIKSTHALALKKFRDDEQLFIAEGDKIVSELLPAYPVSYVAALPEWLSTHPLPKLSQQDIDEVTPDELQRISLLKTPQKVFAVFKKPDTSHFDINTLSQELCIALDDIQNPGNLGTIIRLADWFGITHIFCSLHTVDAFSPKTVQATMGALARVQVHYTPLIPLFEDFKTYNIPIYGTFLSGKNLYAEPLSQNGLIVMGNEGNGISPELEQHITHKLNIPPYPAGRPTSESLNVAVATAIVCAEFRRKS